MADQSTNSALTTVVIIALLAVAFAGGYYFYQQKDKDATLELNVGGESSSLTVDQ